MKRLVEEVVSGRGSRAFRFVLDVIMKVCLLRKWNGRFVFPTSNEKCVTLHCAIQYVQVGVASLNRN